ncbi:hypothetical protein J4464_02370 [Candidatus Woesearchaeota archaeon]|nr:hypothetical protein [Candidatus Woesearchaeota archaeon]
MSRKGIKGFWMQHWRIMLLVILALVVLITPAGCGGCACGEDSDDKGDDDEPSEDDPNPIGPGGQFGGGIVNRTFECPPGLSAAECTDYKNTIGRPTVSGTKTVLGANQFVYTYTYSIFALADGVYRVYLTGTNGQADLEVGILDGLTTKANSGDKDDITVDYTEVCALSTTDEARERCALLTTSVAPVLAQIGDKAARQNQEFRLQLSAADPDCESASCISFSADNAIFADHFIQGNLIKFTPSQEDVENSPYDITVTVTDVDGLTDSERFRFTIQDVNDAPVLSIPAISFNQGSSYSFSPRDYATDIDGDTLSFTVTAGTMLTASYDRATSTILINPANAYFNGPSDIRVTANDGTTTTPQTVQVTVVDTPDDPWIEPPIPAQNLVEDFAPYTLDLTPYEKDLESSGPGLQWSVSGFDAQKIQITLLNRDQDQFTVRPVANADGTTSASFTLTDESGRSTSQDVTFTIVSVNDPPNLKNIPDVVMTNSEVKTVQLSSYIEDPDTPLNQITVEVANYYDSNGAILEGQIVNDAAKTLTLRPRAGFIGFVALNIGVSDGTNIDMGVLLIEING